MTFILSLSLSLSLLSREERKFSSQAHLDAGGG